VVASYHWFVNGQHRVNGAAAKSLFVCRHFIPPSPETLPDSLPLHWFSTIA
jgi:hypothetical protein